MKFREALHRAGQLAEYDRDPYVICVRYARLKWWHLFKTDIYGYSSLRYWDKVKSNIGVRIATICPDGTIIQ